MFTRSSGAGERGNEFLSLPQKRPSDGRTANAGLSCLCVRRTTLGSERNSFPHASRLLALTASAFLSTLPVYAKQTPKAPVQTAIIKNTGSTNTLGYQIQVSSDGSVMRLYTSNDVPYGSHPFRSGPFTEQTAVKSKPIALQDASKFFQDLDAAMPLTSLPAGHGMHSVSFGTRTFITYKGQNSPDLTFAFDPRTAALKADIDSITKALHVGNAPRRPVVIDKSGAVRPIIIHADR